MNFLGLRSNQTAASEQSPTVEEVPTVNNHFVKQTSTLEGLIAEDSSSEGMSNSYRSGDSDYGSFASSSSDESTQVDGINHIDVIDEEGWIAIPYKELPENWSEAPDTGLFRSLDRTFVFPGEQVHILACLSAKTEDTEVITPFKVAAMMNKNGIDLSRNKPNDNLGGESQSISENNVQALNQSSPDRGKSGLHQHTESGEILLRMEDHKKQKETLLQRFNNSHFFVRIAESEEPLWSKRGTLDPDQDFSDSIEKSKIDSSDGNKTARKNISLSAIVDRGNFNSRITGGVARNSVKCCSLSNGEIVVLLQINVGADELRDPVLEILQFEKYHEKGSTHKNGDHLVRTEPDPCAELLRWLLPLDNYNNPLTRTISPPQLSYSASIRSTSIKPTPTSSGSSGSQIFSFGNFRSYSMSSLPQNSVPATPVTGHSSSASFDMSDRDQFSFQKVIRDEKIRSEKLLSFRGVPLEPRRFSVRCGLEGIYIPGRRWRRKIKIIQPVEIRSFAADCNTEDLLCVQIKNICPSHVPDIVVYIDAVTVVYEDASNGGPPSCFRIACIEAGIDHSLPNLGLRRGEEHSFILKPTTSCISDGRIAKTSKSSGAASGDSASAWRYSSYYADGNHNDLSTDQYAVLVSCRCNYTESRLFFKQPTNWRPHVSRDLMISVASEMSRQPVGSTGEVAQLPAQVLTLQASNLTSEDLTLTVLAPASFTSPPSLLSLSSSPSSPMSPFISVPAFTAGVTSDTLKEPGIPITDILPSSDLGCTHLWLQSRVPLGCVPAKSTATIKLEVLPLTDGIIALDSLQIDVKEKGVKYVPEQSLKINATSSITVGTN